MNTNINLALYVQSNFNCKSDIFNIFEMLYYYNTIIIILNIKNIWDHYPIKNNRLIPFLIFL